MCVNNERSRFVCGAEGGKVCGGGKEKGAVDDVVDFKSIDFSGCIRSFSDC